MLLIYWLIILWIFNGTGRGCFQVSSSEACSVLSAKGLNTSVEVTLADMTEGNPPQEVAIVINLDDGLNARRRPRDRDLRVGVVGILKSVVFFLNQRGSGNTDPKAFLHAFSSGVRVSRLLPCGGGTNGPHKR